MRTAFVYTETDNSPESSRKGMPIYTIHYTRSPSRDGCKMQSPDEDFFINEIKDLRRKNNLTLVSKLPPKMRAFEGYIKREPYILSLPLQASAGNKGNKQKAKK